MEYLNQMITILQGLITVCAGVRIALIIFTSINEPDEGKNNGKRIKNTIIFWIAAMGATTITAIIRNYF